MSDNTIFKISFFSHGTAYEIYARQVAQSSMIGFIEIEELIFGENSSVVVDPSEEKLKNEFNGVKRSYIPMHNIFRIDEVSREGCAKITEIKSANGNVSYFPGMYNAESHNNDSLD